MKYRLLYKPNTAFGGSVYTATTNDEKVRLHEDGRCKLIMDVKDFDKQVSGINWDFSTIAALIESGGELSD